MPLAPLAYNSSNIALQTPPVVSAGAVAYGVTTAPAFMDRRLAWARSATHINNQPEPRVVTFTLSQRRSPGGPAENDRTGFWLRY